MFLALVKCGFLYGSESWTLAKGLEKNLGGTYTKFLRMDFNVSWSEHLTNSELYSNLSKVSLKIGPRKLKLSGNCVRHPEEIAFAIRLYFMANIKRMTKQRVKKRLTYVDNLMKDNNMERMEELGSPILQ